MSLGQRVKKPSVFGEVLTARPGGTRPPMGPQRIVIPITASRQLKKAMKGIRRLPPGDPVGLLGAIPVPSAWGNVIALDDDYTIGQEDRIILATETVTVTMTPSPLTAYPVYIIADGGNVTVDGPIQGGDVTLLQGTIGVFAYSPYSGTWSEILSASGPSATPTWGIITPGTPYDVLTTDIGVEGNTSTGQQTVVMPASPNIRTLAVKKLTSDEFSIEVQGNGNELEDPQNRGNYAANVYVQAGPTNSTSWTWGFDGTLWQIIGGA